MALFAATAHATVGGPELAEVLGWDAVDQKAFVALHHFDDSGYFPTVLYFDLRRPSPLPMVVRWSLEDTPEHARKMSALRRRLRLLRPVPASTIPFRTEILKRDSIDGCGNRWARYRLKVEGRNVAFEAITVRDSVARLVSLYAIPGRKERLGLISFVGIACESGYEVQVPVLLDGKPLLVKWTRYRQ